MIGGWFIHGHAIVSADDRIADRTGATPPDLRNEADWTRFQKSLDGAAVTVLGRLGHAANPNFKGRNRVVLSSSARGVERRADAWWWNPGQASFAEALNAAAPGGGIVAVPGGRAVFDLFLDIGFDAFDLSRARRVEIPDGVPIFSAVGQGGSAERILSGHGLAVRATELIDPFAQVEFASWRRP